jgi:hypothetical protein
MRKTISILILVLAASPLGAGQATIQTLQKRIQIDRKDILFYMNRIKGKQAKLKRDQAKAAQYSVPAGPQATPAGNPDPGLTPVQTPSRRDKWPARVEKDIFVIESDRAMQEKIQKDLAQANAQLSALLAKP